MEQKAIKSLEDLFKDYKGDYVPSEWDTGVPVGKEREITIDAPVDIIFESDGEAFQIPDERTK